MSEEKLYTRKTLRAYAQHCMIQLVTKYPRGKDEMGEVSPLDLCRIYKILHPKKKKK